VEPTDQNRKAWDEIHRRRTASMEGQLGIPVQIRELLPDVAGKHVLHLQCATGESTAELVELGALVTAVDLSTEALEAARERAPDVAYVHADVHELPLELHRHRFDLVFTGGGVLGSLRDLDQWASSVATALKPRGTFLLYDSYPVTDCVDPLGHWRENYFERTEEHPWRLEEIVDAVVGAGLAVIRLAEFQTLYKWIQRDRRVPWEFALLAEKRE
jgi:SAM-dependent methyltransferase